LSMLRTPPFCVNPFPSFWATKNPINSKGHPSMDGLNIMSAPGEITSDILSNCHRDRFAITYLRVHRHATPLRVRFAHSNSLPANLSNSYRSNSPVMSDFHDP